MEKETPGQLGRARTPWCFLWGGGAAMWGPKFAQVNQAGIKGDIFGFLQ